MNQQPNPNLARILDELQVKTNPLPTSFIADKVDNHIKTTYATLMASILLYKPVGGTESRLFAMQLTALGLDDDISKYFNLVKDLNTKQVLEFCQTLDAAEKQLTFLFDCLMLCRAGSPLNEQQIFLFNEFVNIWQIDNKELLLLIFWLYAILGIEIKININELGKFIDESIISNINVCNLTVAKEFGSMVKMGTLLGEYFECYNLQSGFDFEIHYWNYKVGNKVKEDCGLVHIETSKSIYDYKCPKTGILNKILIEKGKVKYNQNFAQIVEENCKQVKAMANGIFLDMYIDDREKLNYSILSLPTYLNNWSEIIPHVNYEAIKKW